MLVGLLDPDDERKMSRIRYGGLIDLFVPGYPAAGAGGAGGGADRATRAAGGQDRRGRGAAAPGGHHSRHAVAPGHLFPAKYCFLAANLFF